MYKCQMCQRTIPPRTRAHRIVVETRPRQYPFRPKANRVIVDGREKFVDDPGGEGWEIVREAIVCPECAARIRH